MNNPKQTKWTASTPAWTHTQYPYHTYTNICKAWHKISRVCRHQ